MSLRQQLNTQLNKEGFISVSTLKQLITETSVEKRLRIRALPAQTQVISAIVSKASKLFSILVLIECDYHIAGLIADGITDNIFPIAEEDKVTYFEVDQSRQDFFKLQRQFPPVFETETHMDWPENTKLPFLEKTWMNSGAFGLIYRVRVADGHLTGHQSSGFVALKKIVKRDQDEWDTLMREADTLRKREHENIVPLLASFTLNTFESEYEVKSLNLIFPYAESDLERLMNSPKKPQWLCSQHSGRHDERTYLYNAIYSLVSALAFIHREIGGMITSHHDLKPKNILVIGETLKICDFGRSHLIPLEQGSETEGQKGLGTFIYHPPEYWNEDGTRASRSHGRAFDVWSMGCMVVELATLIVYGWESEHVKVFRENRTSFQNGPRKFRDRSLQGSLDDSFHNNMDIVRQWMSQMIAEDESRVLVQVLKVAEGMLEKTPEDRLYSWEAELNLYELLNPDHPKVLSLKKMATCIQPPRKKDYSNTRTPVHRASIQGNRDRITALLEVGWPADEVDSTGHSPCQLAEENKHHSIRELLEKSIADSTIVTSKSINLPINGKLMVQETLLTQDVYERTLLHWAAIDSDINTVRSILGRKFAHQEVWVADGFGKLPIHYASEKPSVEIFSLLLETSTDPDKLVSAKDCNGKLPLHWAAQKGNKETVEILLGTGRCSNSMIQDKDDNGKSPLQLASKYDHIEVVKVLQQFTSLGPTKAKGKADLSK